MENFIVRSLSALLVIVSSCAYGGMSDDEVSDQEGMEKRTSFIQKRIHGAQQKRVRFAVPDDLADHIEKLAVKESNVESAGVQKKDGSQERETGKRRRDPDAWVPMIFPGEEGYENAPLVSKRCLLETGVIRYVDWGWGK